MINNLHSRNRGLQLVLKLYILFFLGGCVSLPSEPFRVEPIKAELLLKDICKQNNIYWQWDSISQVVTLNLPRGEAKLLVGSNIVLVAGTEIILDEPIRISKSSVVVPRDFEIKVIGDLSVRSMDIDKCILQKVQSVVIDAGHGGKDSGAIGRSGIYEKHVVLDISKRVKKILQRNKLKVVMTRDNDDFETLKRRTEIACDEKVDIFVSIHANSSLSRSASGVEVYSLQDLDRVGKNEDQRKINTKIMFKGLSMDQNSSDLQDIISDMLYVRKKPESDLLAQKVVDRISKLTKASNRGVKESKFFVVRNTLMPAILVEVGFLSNPKEERLLNTSAYRQKIAVGLSRGILDYASSQ